MAHRQRPVSPSRRRCLTALGALGLWPLSRAGAQTESGAPPTYSCTHTQRNADGTASLQVATEGKSNEPKTWGAKFEIAAPMASDSFKNGGKSVGSVRFNAVVFVEFKKVAGKQTVTDLGVTLRNINLEKNGGTLQNWDALVLLAFDEETRWSFKTRMPYFDPDIYTPAVTVHAKDRENHRSDANRSTYGTSALATNLFNAWKQKGSVQIGVYYAPDESLVFASGQVTLDFAAFQSALDAELAKQSGQIDRGECPLRTNFTGVPCFLTTATAEFMGLADDCWELETLRNFRDAQLPRLAGGPEIIHAYDRIAPGIVAGVNARADRARLWSRAYLFYILPIAIAVRAGRHAWAIRRYKRLVTWLRALGTAAT